MQWARDKIQIIPYFYFMCSSFIVSASYLIWSFYVFHLSHLLYLGNNTLTGTIPSEIGLLTNLNYLELCKR